MINVAVLGMGIMGSAIARNLLRAGLDVPSGTARARRPRRSQATARRLRTRRPERPQAADIVLTMLTDWEAVEAAMAGPDGALEAMSGNAIWVQMSTIGIAGTERAAQLARRPG